MDFDSTDGGVPNDDGDFAFEPFARDDDAGAEKSLRPKRLTEFVGQRRVVDNLRLAIDAATAREEVLDHILLSGMPGLGKTTLSLLIASEMGAGAPKLASGPPLERGKDVVGLLTDLRQGDILFIDEIHRMSSHAEEYLYSAMEDFRVEFMIDSGADARSIPLPIQPFTLVGATTREGLLTAPLRGRFHIVEKLEPYPSSDLDQIIRRSASLLGCEIDPAASGVLSKRCRGTPRFANRFLRRVRDVAQARTGGWKPGECLEITGAHVDEALARLGVDENGLDRIDRDVLRVLFEHGDQPVGLKTIAVSVGEEDRTIEDVYEPFLIREGLIVKTSRGRRASQRAVELYGRDVS